MLLAELACITLFLWYPFLFTKTASAKVIGEFPRENEISDVSTIGAQIDTSNPVELSFYCIPERLGGTPIILIHGLATSKMMWRTTAEKLALESGRRICVPDLRNHGDSPRSDDSTVEVMSSDINNFIDKLKLEKVILFGSSLGGKIAMHTALNHPEKIEKVIVSDMRPNTMPLAAFLSFYMYLKVLKLSVKEIPPGSDEATAQLAVAKYLNTMNTVDKNAYTSNEEALFLPLKSTNGTWEWKTNLEAFGDSSLSDFFALWTKSTGFYEGPVLFLYGEKSPVKVGKDGVAIRKLFPKAKMFEIKGAYHVLDQDPAFMEEILKFIDTDI